MEQTNAIIKYGPAVRTIKSAILQGQYEAAKGVTRIQLAVYYAIGKYISVNTRKQVWGTHALEIISEQLQKELPGLRGYSANNMKNMRKFYEQWIMLDAEKVAVTNELMETEDNSTIAIVENAGENATIAIVDAFGIENQIDIYHPIVVPNTMDFPVEDFFRIPFTHHIRIIEGVRELKARYYYIHRAAEEHLSVKTLTQIIGDEAYKHQGDIPNNFTKTIADSQEARKAVLMFKDDYLLNFINVEQIEERNKIDVDERVLEQEIVNNIKTFIMTFGHDFTFVGNQYHLEIYGVEQFPDLLFFNRELNALVVVELKMGGFKTSYLGQLFGYLQILDDHVRKPHENHSIGIVLCREADHAYAEYAVRDYSKPMGVATYKTIDDMPESWRKTLPDMQKVLDYLNGKKDL